VLVTAQAKSSTQALIGFEGRARTLETDGRG